MTGAKVHDTGKKTAGYGPAAALVCLLVLGSIGTGRAQDQSDQDEISKTQAELEQLNSRLDSTMAAIKKSYHVEDEEMQALQAEIKSLTDELERLYALPPAELEQNRARIEEIKTRLSTLETKAQQQTPAPTAEPAAAPVATPAALVPEPSQPQAQAKDTTQAAPKNIIKRLVVTGNDRTNDLLLVRAGALREGFQYTAQREKFSRTRLDLLDVLYDRRYTVAGDSLESLTVFLRVSDLKGWAANPIDFMAATAKGLAGGEVALSYHNLAGKGRKITGSLEWDWQWDMEKKGTLSLRVPYFLWLPFWCDFYLFDWKETWHTGLFREDDVTLLEYGGGAAWYHMFTLWLEGRLGAEYYQRTFNRTFADGDIFSVWTRWTVTTARLKDARQFNTSFELLLDYNAYHPMSTLEFDHYGRSEAVWWLKKGLGRKLTASGRLIGGWSTHDIPLDRQFRFGTERVMRGHQEYRRLGTIEACATAELPWQVTRRVSIIPFVDAGGLWNHGADMSFDDVERDAGLGVEGKWPVIGRCRLDYAHGIDSRASTNWNLHFTYDREIVR